MDNALLITRVVLAAVFFVAGFAKLRDRAGTIETVVGFGVSQRLAPVVATLLPLAEVAVALALSVRSTTRYGAAAGLVLLGVFLIGISVNLRRGRRPDCHCFGQLHSEQIGRSTVARNLVLCALAGVVLWQGGEAPGRTGLPGAGGLAVAAWLALLGLVVVQGWLLLNLLRQNGRVLLRLDDLEQALSQAGVPLPHRHHAGRGSLEMSGGLPVGTGAPPFTLPDPDGALHTLDSLLADGKPLLLFFSDPNCGPCTALMPELRRWEDEHPGELTLAVVTPLGNEDSVPGARPRLLLVDEGREVSRAYRAFATPAAVIVRSGRVVASPVATGPDPVRRLLARGADGTVDGRGHQHRTPASSLSQRPKRGDPVPPLALPDLEGRIVRSDDLQGTSTILVFWNPACAFCQQMLPHLRAWEARRREGDSQLLVVSTGTVEANRAMELRSRIVLDQSFAVGGTFGVPGTPSALLVDRAGKLASDLAVGVPAVKALLRERRRSRRAS